MVFDTFKNGIDVVLHPAKGVKAEKTIGGALLVYYKFSVIPIILLAIVALGAGFALQGVSVETGLVSGALAGSLPLIAIAGVIIYVWGLLPLALLVYAIVLDWVGNALKAFSGKYPHTLTAVLYGSFGPLALLWFSVIPVIGSIVQLIAFVWSMYVLVVLIANQNKTSRVISLIVVVTAGVVTWLLIAVIAQYFAVGFIGSIVGPLLGAGNAVPHAGVLTSP